MPGMRSKGACSSAEELAFNSQGACPKCGGTGSVRTVDLDSLVPDDSLSIDEGAVAPGTASCVIDDGCLPGNGSADRCTSEN